MEKHKTTLQKSWKNTTFWDKNGRYMDNYKPFFVFLGFNET